MFEWLKRDSINPAPASETHLFEISNDDGDRAIIHARRGQFRKIQKMLDDNGVEPDPDPRWGNSQIDPRALRNRVARRNSSQLRAHSARVYDPKEGFENTREDYEDGGDDEHNGDLEDDRYLAGDSREDCEPSCSDVSTGYYPYVNPDYNKAGIWRQGFEPEGDNDWEHWEQYQEAWQTPESRW